MLLLTDKLKSSSALKRSHGPVPAAVGAARRGQQREGGRDAVQPDQRRLQLARLRSASRVGALDTWVKPRRGGHAPGARGTT